MEKAMFGAGCFWGVETTFRKIKGVINVVSGYSGGTLVNPSYKDVCTGRTGHAEVVQVEYDPQVVSYDELLHVFWISHDPTTLNRQGPDIGSQYRSIIFYYTADQEEKARRSKEQLERSDQKEIVTTIEPAGTFYKAEDYHQRYLEKHGQDGCHL
jgi:peptide-methionine (S)-S-oxide reductase